MKFTEDMIERAAEVIEEMESKHPEQVIARAALAAAFRDVDPTSYYFLNPFVQKSRLVIILPRHEGGAMVLRAGGDDEAMERLGHHVEISYGHTVEKEQYVRSVKISKLPPPGEINAVEPKQKKARKQ